MSTKSQKDLVVLVADADIEHAIRGLMERPRALRIRDGITLDIFKEPNRDPGVLRQAHEFLRNFQANYQYALVIFDREGCGHANKSARQLECEVEKRLESAGWRNRCAVVVLDPELESWVFVNSPHVINIIAKGDGALYQSTLAQCNRLPNGKPQHPKEVMEELLRKKLIPRSSSLYLELARQVSLSRCQDTSFQRFRHVLQTWFPP
jgi:hypothetical protein